MTNRRTPHDGIRHALCLCNMHSIARQKWTCDVSQSLTSCLRQISVQQNATMCLFLTAENQNMLVSQTGTQSRIQLANSVATLQLKQPHPHGTCLQSS